MRNLVTGIMRKLVAVLLVLAGCSSKSSSEDTRLTLARPQNFAITVSGVDFLGSAVWGMAVASGTPESDWLRVHGKVDAAGSTVSSLREVSLDVPLNLSGEWSGTRLRVAYDYSSYSEASSLGVANLYWASVKSWQEASVSGEGEAPEQQQVDDAAAPPSPSNGQFPTDYIDSSQRYVVRAVDMAYGSSASGTRLAGSIVLQPDDGELPERFDREKDLILQVDGVLSAFECRSTRGVAVQETGVEVLQPDDRMDQACKSRFNLQ